MFKQAKLKSYFAAVSTAVATSVLIASPINAEENPFQMSELSDGYMVADKEGKCGMAKKMKKIDTDGDGAVSKDEFMAHAEKKFAKKDKNGDGVLSSDEMKRMKKHGEGKCGEGKCGGKKSDS